MPGTSHPDPVDETAAILDRLGAIVRAGLPDEPPALREPDAGTDIGIGPGSAAHRGGTDRAVVLAPPTPGPSSQDRRPRRGLEWARVGAAAAVVAVVLATAAWTLRADDESVTTVTGEPTVGDTTTDPVDVAGSASIPEPRTVTVAELTGLPIEDALAAALAAGHGLEISLVVPEAGDVDGTVRWASHLGGAPILESETVYVDVATTTQTREGMDARQEQLVAFARTHPDVVAGINMWSSLTPTHLSLRPDANLDGFAEALVDAAGFRAGGAMPSTLAVRPCILEPADLDAVITAALDDIGAATETATLDPGTCQLDLSATPEPIELQLYAAGRELDRLHPFRRYGGPPLVVSEWIDPEMAGR